ncbi:MAG: TetR/AcrR family transcriptional regulator [Sphingomonadales bacterium]|nr:TetR/AcrR family transcriptional regulator [Sphingomonadales bacterium]
MSDEGNSVNIKDPGAKSAGSYHHGDLRAAVIAAGLKRLEEGDGAELGLRALARDVGVSATALYRHFPDKEALLDALADEGLRRLGALQAQAWLKAGGGRAGFLATGVAYVRFAHEEPAVFRLNQTMPHLENPEVAALHAWSLVHGLAMLVLDRRIGWDEALIGQIVGMTFGGVD